nr:zinc finger protein RFP-like [Anolis sagrei ordinatus]
MELSYEWTCPICLETFKNPVTIDCGHNFCQACLSQYWGASNRCGSCPQCQQMVPQRNFQPNRLLVNMIKRVQKLEEEKRTQWKKMGTCAKHWLPLDRFCKEDETTLCSVCERSKEHLDHVVVSWEDVIPEYKDQIEANMKSLQKRRMSVMKQMTIEDHGRKECLNQIELENQKISSAFDQMNNFLKEKKGFWLGQLQDLESSIKEKYERNISTLSKELLSLSNLIAVMNEKFQQPADEFLQDIKSTLKRFEKRERDYTPYLLPGLEGRLQTFSQKVAAVEMTMRVYTDSLEYALTKAWSPKQMPNKVDVTLDPNTANTFLILSEDLKNVICGVEEQNLPNVPERFDWEPCVLGSDRFTSGNPWWEVEVKEEGEMWVLGVAKETIRRKKSFIPSPSEDVWAIGKPSGGSFSSNELWAFTFPKPILLNLRHNPQKILVSLNYEEGCVEFFDADSDERIFTFSAASFRGETIRPFFWVTPGVWLKC